jgi:hypothetical protein
MKKFLLLICLFIMFVSTKAQYSIMGDIYKQRERVDTLSEFPDWNEVQKDSTLIVFNEDSTLVINNKEKIAYKINNVFDWSAGVDPFDNDRWNGFMAVCADDDGIMVKLTIIKYESGTILLTVTYGTLEFRYQGRKYIPEKLIKV